jgi:hypothetical protein
VIACRQQHEWVGVFKAAQLDLNCTCTNLPRQADSHSRKLHARQNRLLLLLLLLLLKPLAAASCAATAAATTVEVAKVRAASHAAAVAGGGGAAAGAAAAFQYYALQKQLLQVWACLGQQLQHCLWHI